MAFDLSDYKDAALDNRPELAALRHAIRATEAKVSLRKAEFLPDLAVMGNFFYSLTPGRDDITNWVLVDNYNRGPGFMVGRGALDQLHGRHHSKLGPASWSVNYVLAGRTDAECT